MPDTVLDLTGHIGEKMDKESLHFSNLYSRRTEKQQQDYKHVNCRVC